MSACPSGSGDELERRWGELLPWPEAPAVLEQLPACRWPSRPTARCGWAAGQPSASACRSAVVETAESVGFYKPRPEVYRAVLQRARHGARTHAVRRRLGLGRAGRKAVGMPVYWHNRIGLAPRDDASPNISNPRSTGCRLRTRATGDRSTACERVKANPLVSCLH